MDNSTEFNERSWYKNCTHIWFRLYLRVALHFCHFHDGTSFFFDSEFPTICLSFSSRYSRSCYPRVSLLGEFRRSVCSFYLRAAAKFVIWGYFSSRDITTPIWKQESLKWFSPSDILIHRSAFRKKIR